MKKIILSSILLALVMLSCNQKNKEAQDENGEVVVKVDEKYSCPMHPEEVGKKGILVNNVEWI